MEAKILFYQIIVLLILNASILTAQNFTLLSHYIPESGSAFDVSFKNDTCFVISDSELEILDISDIESPKYLLRTNAINGRKLSINEISANNVEKYFAFIDPMNFSTPGIKMHNVDNIHNLPDYTLLFENDLIIDFKVVGNQIYTIADSSFKVYDLLPILDNLEPLLLSEVKTSHKNTGLTISTNYVYLGQENGIAVIDITEITNALLITEYSDYEYMCPFDITIQSGIIYNEYFMVPSRYCQEFCFFDIIDPLNPSIVDYSPEISGEITSAINDGCFLYYTVMPNNGGLYMVDITNPLAPIESGSFKNSPKAGGLSVKIKDNILFYCGLQNTEGFPENQQGGLFILKNNLITAIDGMENIPHKFGLEQNYPNPFNPSTIVEYSIAEDGFVELKVFNALGEEIADLVSEYLLKGRYDVEFKAAGLPSGIYFYRLAVDQQSTVKKMLLLK
jgi:hypothetical protein